ncbi:MAG: efflux RND transporter periplasmic adaptor subunit [Deltaproteobacteria bacterium]|nr:efflux RND transporter periplasmic adaptor subunit [Deltaproteobacteria bacterium]
MTKRMVIMLVLVGMLFGGIFGFQAFKAQMIKKFMTARAISPQTVSTLKATEQSWQPQLEVVGTLRAVHGADLAPEVSGTVTGINFQSGKEVETGTLLLTLNAAADLARLQSLKAVAELAKQTFLRDQQQFKEKVISQATLDAATANLKDTRARIAAQQALIDKKFIRAPFAGRLGIRAVDLGQYLNAGTKIVTLQALDPIFIDFYLPQKAISQIKVRDRITVKTDAFPGQNFAGEISAINPTVDLNTRNVVVRARVDNPRHQLLPGMFATADIRVAKPRRYLTLPQTAITFNPYGTTVFLVEEQGKGPDGKPRLVAQQKFVTTGETRGDQIAILDGIKPGEEVVTSGQIKLRNGTPVIINNTIQPTNNPAPTPKDK